MHVLRTMGLASLIATLPISANAALHSLGNFQVGFKNESGFTPVEGLWGVGFSLVSEIDQKTGLRSSIGVFDMEMSDVHFDYGVLRKNLRDFYSGRKKWLEKLEGASFKRELPFEEIHQPKDQIDGYRIGFEYLHQGVTQKQYSYFLMCKKRMFHIKTLSPNESTQKQVDEIVSSFQCSRDSDAVAGFDRDSIKEAWKKSKKTSEKRKALVSTLRQFLLDYEDAHENKNYPDSDARIQNIKTWFERAFGLETAWAAQGACFFAGWQSQWIQSKKGGEVCAKPQGAKGCGPGKIQCNPLAFGPVCISSEFTQNATMACNAAYEANLEVNDSEIEKYITDESHAGELDQLTQSIDEICGQEPYASSNYGLCTTLYDRVAKIAKSPEGKRPPLATNAALDTADYDQAYDYTQEQLQLFENVCLSDDKSAMHEAVQVDLGLNEDGSPNTKTINCVELKNNIIANLTALDKIKPDTQFKEITSGNCPGCGFDEAGAPADLSLQNQLTQLQATVEEAPAECTAKEKADMNHCWEDVACTIGASTTGIAAPLFKGVKVGSCDLGQDGCLIHALGGIKDALWGTVKGVYNIAAGLVSDAGKAAWNGVKGVGNWFGMSNEIEDASSYKVVQLANTTGGFLSDFIKDPWGTMGKLWDGITSALRNYLKNDALCSEWSGTPHFSKCTAPSTNVDCLSCKQVLNGGCHIVGYIGSYIAGALITGGVKGALDAAGISAKIGSMLSAAGKAGKINFTAIAQKMASVAPSAVKGTAKALYTGTKAAVKGTGTAIYNVGKYGVVGPIKMLHGGAKSIVGKIRKIPLVGKPTAWTVTLPYRIVKWPPNKVAQFARWYTNHMRKAFTLGEKYGSKLGQKVARKQAAQQSTAPLPLTQDEVISSQPLKPQPKPAARAPSAFEGTHAVEYKNAVDAVVKGESFVNGLGSSTNTAFSAATKNWKNFGSQFANEVEKASAGKIKLTQMKVNPDPSVTIPGAKFYKMRIQNGKQVDTKLLIVDQQGVRTSVMPSARVRPVSGNVNQYMSRELTSIEKRLQSAETLTEKLDHKHLPSYNSVPHPQTLELATESLRNRIQTLNLQGKIPEKAMKDITAKMNKIHAHIDEVTGNTQAYAKSAPTQANKTKYYNVETKALIAIDDEIEAIQGIINQVSK